MNIEYKNLYGINLLEENLEMVDYYDKIFFENSQKKIIETYENKKLVMATFYLNNEKIENILNKFSYEKISFHTDKIIQGNYTYYKCLLYNKRELKEISIIVVNGDNSIFFQRLDINTQQPIFTTTEKWYYDEQGEEKYLFDYDENGDLLMINDLQEFKGDVLASRIEQDDSINFTWEGMEYYKDAHQIFPNVEHY